MNIIWKNYLSRPNKIQFINSGLGNAFDTNFCITFSALKPLQAALNYQVVMKTIPQSLLDWAKEKKYLNKDGMFNFSPRYTGTMADTTIYGNTQWNVCNAIYAYGLIPEVMHPNIANSWAEYADEGKITQEMKDLGAEFLKKFDISDVDTSELDNSPLQGIVRYAEGSGILSPVGKTNHGTTIENEESDHLDTSDSYWQEEKMYAKDKVFYLKGFIIKPKIMTQDEINKFLKDNDKKWVRNSQNGSFGRILQGKLMQIHSTDRGALALLDDKVRQEGISIDNTKWYALPLGDF